MQNIDPLAPNRQCGSCEMCCVYTEIREGDFFKPACTGCPLLDRSSPSAHGCSVHSTSKQPRACAEFECSWLRGFGGENDRPDKNGVMVSVNQVDGKNWVFVMDIKKNGHKTTGKKIILDMVKTYDFPVIVVDHANLAHGTGDYVILKDSLLPRSGQIAGTKLSSLNKNVHIYKLLKGV